MHPNPGPVSRQTFLPLADGGVAGRVKLYNPYNTEITALTLRGMFVD